MFGLQKTRKAVPVAQVQTGKTSMQPVNIGEKRGKDELLWTLLHFLSVKVSDRAEHLGSGLIHKGLKPGPDTFIGIFAQNRPEVSVGRR